MFEYIIKRDGRQIKFQEDRITNAILKAAHHVANQTGETVNTEIARNLTNEVVMYLDRMLQHRNPSVEEVQDAVIKILIEHGHAKTSESYILYREQRNQVRNKNSHLMNAIKKITFLDSKDADLKRENANVDGNTAMGTMLQYGSAVSKEFCKMFLLSPEFTKYHEEGDIHIHDMDFMNMGTLTCCQIPLDQLFDKGFSTGHGFLRTPQDIHSYAALAAIAIQSNQNDQHGGQSIPAFDYYLAPGVKKTFYKDFFDNLEKACTLLYSDININWNKIKESVTLDNVCLGMDIKSSNLITLLQDYQMTEEQTMKILTFAYDEASKSSDRKTYQAMEAFVHNLNTMHSRAGAQVPFSSINFGTDTSLEGRCVSKNLLLAQEAGLGNNETPIFPILIFKVKEGVNYNQGDPNYDLFQLSCRVSAKRLFPNFSFLDSTFNKQYYKEGMYESEATYMGCRTRVMGNVNGEETSIGRGNNSFTTINLPRLGIQYGIVTNKTFQETAFFEALKEKIEIVIQQLLERLEIQGNKKVKNFPFLMGQGIWRGSKSLGFEDDLQEVVKQGTLTVGFIGLAECLNAAIGHHHGESKEAQELGIRIVSYMREKLDEATKRLGYNFSLIATPAEGLSGRFTKLDREKFGNIKGVTDREYYTNSFHIPVYFSISVFRKIELEAPYHALTNGGHISYVELDGDPSKNLESFEEIVRFMKEQNIGYGSINHPIDRDPVCGYSGVIKGNVCPNCGREEGTIPFEKIRRITGYLVGTTDRFNNGKAAEERDRLKHGSC